jgi:hypothetical protein
VEKIFKSASQSVDDPLQFVLSDDSTDRMGDTIQVTGWDLTNFKENPIALWAHAATRPIGRWVDVRVVGNKLMGKLVFADAGTSPMIDEIRSLVEQRILKTVSVGFNPLDAEPIRDPKGKMTGFNFIKQDQPRRGAGQSKCRRRRKVAPPVQRHDEAMLRCVG